jgi:hypothetical protein
MLRIFLSRADLNCMLGRVDPSWRYDYGCFAGHIKLPIGAVSLTAVPSMEADFLLISLPLDEMKGKLTGGLFGQAARLLWGMLQNQIHKQALLHIMKLGLPADTVQVGRNESCGQLRVSLYRVNQWLALHYRFRSLKLFVSQILFFDTGVEISAGLFRP